MVMFNIGKQGIIICGELKQRKGIGCIEVFRCRFAAAAAVKMRGGTATPGADGSETVVQVIIIHTSLHRATAISTEQRARVMLLPPKL